jgi:hypothetical protein
LLFCKIDAKADLFIYCFFNGTVNSEYVASNDRMINEKLYGKDMQGSGCGLIEATVRHLYVGIETNHDNSG